MSMGTFFERRGAESKNDRIVTIRPSTVGDQPTRGVLVGAEPGPPRPRSGGFILAMTVFPAANSFDHSIFCRAVMSLGETPSSFKTWRENSFDCSPLGILPPPPDCTEARWISPCPAGTPSRQVTLDPPPDWP